MALHLKKEPQSDTRTARMNSENILLGGQRCVKFRGRAEWCCPGAGGGGMGVCVMGTRSLFGMTNMSSEMNGGDGGTML